MPRSLLNVSKNGLAIDENRRSPSKMTKLKKSVTITGRKYSLNTKDPGRLVGGADMPDERENISTSSKEIGEPAVATAETNESTSKSEKEYPARSGGPCCACMSQEPGSTGDKKVDQLIDYVQQNLQEAGKALATLGENFEHDSKLMFADILGRIQQWIGLVQNKLDICKAEIDGLRKELIAKACEIDNLRKALADCNEEREKLITATTALTTPSQTVATQLDEDMSRYTEKHDLESINDKKAIQEEPAIMQQERIEIVCTDAAIQSMMKDKEGMRREIELEAEISRLRKENERIIKERAEYESAIQRALLRGVSSLNVEALRVLRCPPIPCCTPCAPCPVSTAEPIVLCKRNGAAVGMAKGCVTHRSSNGRKTICEQGSDTIKRPCASPCCSAKKNRKPTSNNSMVFLLHQGDTENVCGTKNVATPRVCGSPVMKRIEIPPYPRCSK